jgi:endonuclease YncB( thermonuclease family)
MIGASAIFAALLYSGWFSAEPARPVGFAEMRGASFTCTATGVHDGDGPIRCAERGVDGKPIKIRLHAIAAREIDESCSAGHPCPAASGAAAKAELTRLAVGKQLRCEATGRSYDRVTAWCSTQAGVELNCAMVKSGMAVRWEQYDQERRLCRTP